MPNHIQNVLKIVGTPKQVNEIKEAISGRDDESKDVQPILLNNIVPMPPELKITSDNWLMPLENRFSAGTPLKEHLDSLREFMQKNPDVDALDNFLQGIKNYVNHGNATWYNWSVDNWGTKWDAYGFDESPDGAPDNEIWFQTAWAPPLPVIETLAKKYPDVTFELKWADEDTGANTGSFEFKGDSSNGYKPENYSKEGYELYFKLHPGERNNYVEVDGTYEYKE